MYHRSSKKVSAQCIDSSCAFTNERYLNTPQKKAKMEKLRNRVPKAEQSVHSLTVKVLKLTSQGERLDTSFQSDMLSIMHGSQQLIKILIQMEALPDSFGMSSEYEITV